jgi:hypothetical protein
VFLARNGSVACVDAFAVCFFVQRSERSPVRVVNELRDAEVNANRILNINVFDSRLVWVVGIILYDDADCPVARFLLFQNNLVDVCIVWEWSMVVQVEIANLREIHYCMPISARVTIHVKA